MGNRSQAVDFFNSAVKALEHKDDHNFLNHAYHLFVSACMVDPTYGHAFYQAANNAGDMNWRQAAIGCYRRALAVELDKEDRIKTLSNMSWRLHEIGEVEESLERAKQAVELGPEYPYGYVNLACAYGALSMADECLEASYKALELAPDDITVKFELAFACLFARKLKDGFKYFEYRFPARLRHYEKYPYPKWRGEDDKTVYLVADQGMGDTLSFARFIPHAAKKAKFIHAGVQPELLRVFNEAFIGIDNVNFIPIGTGFPAADCWSTFVSLPLALDLSDEEIRAAPHPRYPVYGMADTSWKVPDQKLHIGIAWAGSPHNDIDQWRTIPLERFLELYKVPGIQLYGLQCDNRKEDIVKIGATALIRDLSPWIRDAVDTISVLQHLDLVISLESFLPHLAGAVGKEVWIPYSYHAHDYRLGHDGSDILWYTKHRLFHQGKDKDWVQVFNKVALALRERIAEMDNNPKLVSIDDAAAKKKHRR